MRVKMHTLYTVTWLVFCQHALTFTSIKRRYAIENAFSVVSVIKYLCFVIDAGETANVCTCV